MHAAHVTQRSPACFTHMRAHAHTVTHTQSRTCDDLIHPLHCIHQRQPLILVLHGGSLAAQDFAVRDQPHHQLVARGLGLVCVCVCVCGGGRM